LNRKNQYVLMRGFLRRSEEMQLQIDSKQDRRHRRTRIERRHSSSSTQDKSDMGIFYEGNNERRRRSLTNHARLDKFFRNNVRIPKFFGDSNYNVYEEREKKVEQILFSYDLYDTDIVILIVLEFEGYILFWWNKFQKDVEKGKKQSIKTWVELKAAMKKRFNPTHCRKEFLLKIQRLRH